MSFILKSQQEVMQEIAERAKFKRLEQNLTQEGLALRSGVSLGSIKRFERTGEISLKSLIDIALALGCLEDFDALFADNASRGSLFENREEKKPCAEKGFHAFKNPCSIFIPSLLPRSFSMALSG